MSQPGQPEPQAPASLPDPPCPNCFAGPGHSRWLDQNGNCAVCGKQVPNKRPDHWWFRVEWKIRHIRKLLRSYYHLAEVGSGMCGLVLLELKGAMAELETLENQRGAEWKT